MQKLCAAMLVATCVFPWTLSAQHHDDDDHDHDHGPLHFTHPMVTESPSPDTKARFDFLSYRFGPSGSEVTGSVMRLEAEYAFTHAVSLAVTLPFENRSKPASVNGFGSAELSLKAVTFAQAERGLLLGGGLSTTLPTGSDVNGIGSAHAMEIEPFVHGAYMREKTELVAFLRYSTLTRLQAGEENERELSFDGSALWHAGRSWQVLLEGETSRSDGAQFTSFAPGIELTPFKRPLMLGASVVLGVGNNSRDDKQFLFSAFYHF